MLRLVCATANPGKVAELVALLDQIAVLEQRPAGLGEIAEDASTLEGNARLKAAAVASVARAAALADDTGLEVEALDGRPGVHSARYASEGVGEGAGDAANRAALLTAMAGVIDRRARFRTVIAVVWPDGEELLVEGICTGRLTEAERGDAGFGYDAIFVPDDGDGRTFAEMSLDEKNAISHRGRALQALVAELTSRANRSPNDR